MGYRNLQTCVAELEARGDLVRIATVVDPVLEIALIQRRVYQAGGPALLFTNVRGCRFPVLANLFGTMERTTFIFRDTLDDIRRLVELKLNPFAIAKNPLCAVKGAISALHLLPKRVARGPVLDNSGTVSDLPQIISWPDDGGPFITLPQVYTESLHRPGFRHSNMGMYRIQLAGNDYAVDREIGVHYQIHRGIGVHHAEALDAGKPLRVNVFVGGPPSMAVAAVMPLPEGMPELSFAGLLGGHRIEMADMPGSLPVLAEADFCITGTIEPGRIKPEGPFGDHIGYYSLVHDFPVMNVESVHYRKDAIWPYTAVGRPPQEDTTFGAFIHELTGQLIPDVLPGVHAVHAVDEAGVHPLLLAIGSERYVPYASRREPQELLTIANAILGQGQLSLAKYLLIVAHEDNPVLDIHNPVEFITHLLERVDWRRDLHFQTATTIDTLDYSGDALNKGSKLVIAAAGDKIRELSRDLPGDFQLPEGFANAKVCIPGIMAVEGKPYISADTDVPLDISAFADYFQHKTFPTGFPLVVVVDDAEFTARTVANFLWVTFTRSNPAADVYGVGAAVFHKHWGCSGPLIIDARLKPHHAPPLLDDPNVVRKVEALAAPGEPLHGII